jgi:hypothetical protein
MMNVDECSADHSFLSPNNVIIEREMKKGRDFPLETKLI